MTNKLFAPSLNARTETRRRFGRSISMDILEAAMRTARRGSMRDITDLLRETIEFDPHLGSILNKRFGGVANLPWEVQPLRGGRPPAVQEHAQLQAELGSAGLGSVRRSGM
jgi:phage gp29-like protein